MGKWESMGLIDLIFMRHSQLRKLSEKKWSKQSHVPVTNAEWLIIDCIYKQPFLTISQVSKMMDITRQAAHKFIKNLRKKGLVKVEPSQRNNREKCLKLTEQGEAYYKQYVTQKTALEEKIAQALGDEQLLYLKNILSADWGLSEEEAG